MFMSGEHSAAPSWTRGGAGARPLVTVVTPSYNYGKFIRACLESVRRQTYPRIEHLVFDACSTDDSASVIASFEGT